LYRRRAGGVKPPVFDGGDGRTDQASSSDNADSPAGGTERSSRHSKVTCSGAATVKPPFPLTERYGSGLTPVSPVESVGGGFSGATVLKVVCRDGTFAVRGWPAGAEPRRLRGLHRLLLHVAERGVPVAVPLAEVTGDTLVREAGRWWQVEPWLPGRANSRESPSEAKLVALMRALAEFHNAAAVFEPRHEEEEWFGGPVFGVPRTVRERIELMRERIVGGEFAELRATVRATGGGEFGELARRAVRGFERLGEQVSRELRLFESMKVPLVPCLRDVWRDHVLFTGDDVTGLIDPSACRRDTVAADLSRLLGSLLGDDVKWWDTAIAAYAQCRTLTGDEAALIPVLDRSGVLLSAATWLRRRYVLGMACETPEVIGRLREIVERIERMRSAPPG
jgi:Ser/Thr protein kinase RdoA (MazF antagonist)